MKNNTNKIYKAFKLSLSEKERKYICSSFKDFKRFYKVLTKNNIPSSKLSNILCIGLTDPFKKYGFNSLYRMDVV